MSITTDPRTVTTGPCRVSTTSATKRDALIGRTVRVTTYDHPEGLVGIVERIDGGQPIVRFPDGRWAFGGSVVQLVEPAPWCGDCTLDRLTAVTCPSTHHPDACPARAA